MTIHLSVPQTCFAVIVDELTLVLCWRCPVLIWQQAVNEPDTSLVRADMQASHIPSCLPSNYLMLTWINRPQHFNPCCLTVSGFSKPIRCLDTSADGKLLAAGGEDCVVRVLSIDTGEWAPCENFERSLHRGSRTGSYVVSKMLYSS